MNLKKIGYDKYFWRLQNQLIFYPFFIESCNINQTCKKVQDCPYTKKLLEQFEEANDAKEKEKLKASIRSRICGSSADRKVCCDVDNDGKY